MKKTGIMLVLLVLCLLVTVTAAKPQKVETGAYATAVRSYFNEQYLLTNNTDYWIDYDVKESGWLKEHVPGAFLVQAYGMFKMPPVTGTFIFWKERVYLMPDEFNAFIEDSKVKVSSEEDALSLADLYVKAWEPSGSYGMPAAMSISNVEEIPQRGNPVPYEKGNTITLPEVVKKQEGFGVSLSSWCPMGGWLRSWDLVIDHNGKVTGQNKLVGKYIGDHVSEGAIPEKFTPKSALAKGEIQVPTSAIGEGEHTQDVVIDGETRFVIHWRDQDLDTTADGTSAQIVAWEDAALRNAWQKLIVDNSFNPPRDPVIDVYIWNDSTPWGPIASAPGRGASWDIIGNPKLGVPYQEYIYTMNNMIFWGRKIGWYWPTVQQAHDSITGHEFFHGVENSYVNALCSGPIDEGSARFIQTILTPEGEFWQNSPLAGLPPGNYVQDSTHASSYIRETNLIYLFEAYGGNSLDPRKYEAAIYWRYLFEHRGGLATIQDIFDKIYTQCGSYDDQVSWINTALGTTDMGFTDFASANYLEFSPYPFSHDNEFYQFSDRYFVDVPRRNIALTTGSAFPVIEHSYPLLPPLYFNCGRGNQCPIRPFATLYYDIDPGNVKRLKITFNGDDAGSFAVKAFRGKGAIVTEMPLTLDAIQDGSIMVKGGDTADVIGLMIARISTAGDGSWSFQLDNMNTSTPAPEFPSMFLPATMIIGFLGAVLLIQRTREQ